MDWLTKTFAQSSMAWLILSTVAGVLAGVLSGWWTSQLRKKEIVASVVEDIKKQRQFQAMAQEKEREDRIRNAIIQWANPILGAVEDLEQRLKNILDRGYPLLDKNKQGEINPNWSITYEYFMQSSLYLFAQYFAWTQMLRELLSFELFRSEQTKDDFFTAVDAVSRALGNFPHPGSRHFYPPKSPLRIRMYDSDLIPPR